MSQRRLVRVRSFAAALLAAASTALAGCGGLPETGPVRQGLEVGPPNPAPLRLRFEPPRAGATPTEIVRGFLAAGVDLADDAAAPRAFLTGRALRAWNPRARVIVHAGPGTAVITQTSPSTVGLTVQADAVLDAEGRYAELPPGTQRSATIGVARQADGEWRIATLPSDFGLWLSRGYAEGTFSPFRLHYLSTSSRTLVPDVRWLPLVGGGVATTLARAQLEPVPRYLEGAVLTGFPTGTRLSVEAVAIESGVATVDLTGRLLDASSEDQRGAWAQLLATLDQAPGVNQVRVRVEGERLQLPDDRSPVESIGDLGYAGPAPVAGPRLLTRVGSRLAVTDRAVLRGAGDEARGREGDGDLTFPALGPQWQDLAASGELTEVAAVDGGRTVLGRWPATGGVPIRHERLGTALTPPAYDRHGALWVAGLDRRGQPGVWVTRVGAPASAAPTRVALPPLRGQVITALRVAADGQRVAMVLRTAPGQARLSIAGVIRDAQGTPVRVTAPTRVGGALVDAKDLTWIDDISLGVIARGPNDRVARPYVVPLARPSVALAKVTAPVRIVATGEGRSGLLVRTGEGEVLGATGSRWLGLGRFADVVVPGT